METSRDFRGCHDRNVGRKHRESHAAARCRVLLLLGEAQRKSNDFPNALTTLAETAKAASGLGLPEILAQAARATLFERGIALTNAYAQFTRLVGGESELESVRKLAENYRRLSSTREQGMFSEILDRVRKVQSELTSQLQDLTLGNAKNYPDLDRYYLVSPGFIERGGFYQISFHVGGSRTNFPASGLIGDKAARWQKFTADVLGRLQKNATDYKGEFEAAFKDTAVTLIKRTERLQRDAYFAAYAQESGVKLGEPLGFPLAKASTKTMTVDQLREAEKWLSRIAEDLNFPAMPKPAAGENAAWQNFSLRALTLARVSRAILGDELTPISKLSGAFLSPESELHLQFAYYESSLVVEFLVQRYGLEKLRAILRNLGEGMEINEAIAKHTEAMDKLESEFAAFTKARAVEDAPGVRPRVTRGCGSSTTPPPTVRSRPRSAV